MSYGRNNVKSLVGWIIIGGHLFMGAFVLLGKEAVFNPEQKVAVLLVLAPIFSIYFVTVVKGFLADSTELRIGDRVNVNFAAICVLVPIVQFSAVIYVLAAYPDGVAANTEKLQAWLAGLETFLGGSLGLILDNLFPRRQAA